MTDLLYYIVGLVAQAHQHILGLNDQYELYFSDKQLHFWVIGILGMVMILAIHPLFTLLAKTDHILVISWLYVFTVILVLAFAIEIGQGITHTGAMEFDDIVSGIFGFFLLFAIFAVIRGIIRGILGLFKRD